MARRKIIDRIGVSVVEVKDVNDGKVLESVAKHVTGVGCSLARGFPPEVAGVEDAAEVAAEEEHDGTCWWEEWETSENEK